MTPSPTAPGTIFGFPVQTVTTFDNAYWASQPLPVQALQNMTAAQRATASQQLAAQGYFIDVPIMVWGWDPYLTMYARQADGITSYPDALGQQTRPVDLNPADYIPVTPPPVPPAGSELVGAQIGNTNMYFMTQAAIALNLPSGDTTVQNGHSYILVYTSVQNPIGGGVQQIGRWLQIS